MDGSGWERIIVHFQARARGYLVRKEVRCARGDFEEIVKEIDGGLTHLKWVDGVVSVPHFSDLTGPSIPPCTSVRKPPDPGEDVKASSDNRGEHCELLERMEAERDHDLQDCLPAGGGGHQQRQGAVRATDGAVMESTGEASTIWSISDQDINNGQSHKGPQPYCLAQDVPRSPEALRLHRNTLTMELLWIQQAIDSRKKYLSLKDRLSVS